MISEALALLLAQLNQYLHLLDGTPPGSSDPAIAGNISQLENQTLSTDLENHVVLTLVNVAEESSLKNSVRAARLDANQTTYQHPPVFLNLSLLFSANYNNYTTAMRRIAQVVAFFQGKKTFSLANSPGAVTGVSPATELTLHVDLLSLTFEEVNYLWGSLGGKQLPFVLYHGRLLEIRDQRLLDSGGIVQQIDINGRGMM